MFLSIKNLSVSIEDKKILNNFSLEMNKGEVHAIMGPNGCGKSTLSNVIAGKEEYEILDGEIIFRDQNLLDLNVEERSQLGIFLAFQYPIEIPGVNITPFLKAALNAKYKKEGKPEVDPLFFAKELEKVANDLGIKSEMLSRSVNGITFFLAPSKPKLWRKTSLNPWKPEEKPPANETASAAVSPGSISNKDG